MIKEFLRSNNKLRATIIFDTLRQGLNLSFNHFYKILNMSYLKQVERDPKCQSEWVQIRKYFFIKNFLFSNISLRGSKGDTTSRCLQRPTWSFAPQPQIRKPLGSHRIQPPFMYDSYYIWPILLYLYFWQSMNSCRKTMSIW